MAELAGVISPVVEERAGFPEKSELVRLIVSVGILLECISVTKVVCRSTVVDMAEVETGGSRLENSIEETVGFPAG